MNAVKVTIFLQELEALHVPGDMSRVGHDLEFLHRGDETFLLFPKIPLVGKWKGGFRGLENFFGETARRFTLGWKCPSSGSGESAVPCASELPSPRKLPVIAKAPAVVGIVLMKFRLDCMCSFQFELTGDRLNEAKAMGPATGSPASQQNDGFE